MMSVCAIVVVAMVSLSGADEFGTLGKIPLQPDPKNCSAYFEFVPTTKYCPTGLVFSPKQQQCALPADADGPCKAKTCPPPSADGNRSHWEPANCANDPIEIGGKCRLVCNPEFQLSGATEINCTEQGWSAVTGMNQIPSCKTVIETGKDFINKINETLGSKANLMFVIDESGSINKTNFQIELNFVKAVVRAFPLSENRSAGVVTFTKRASLAVSIKQTDTCDFLTAVDKISYYAGGTNILAGLNKAYDEIAANSVHNFTLYLLVTDGLSRPNPTPAADKIKGHGDALFTVGVAQFDEQQLIPLSSRDKNDAPNFYAIKSFEVFEAISDYLATAYSNGSSLNCKKPSGGGLGSFLPSSGLF